ncbi:ATP-binding cassette domain-containing protein [Maricaulis sp.]|uniref:ATP-binding cassette domain-containing protein n=1 Tax=Maricaulis sp. TaxID=1486257 RepID=UPI0025CD9120|nr:ATP-binding cassette domain-containing protein [Maricaulis sp.]MDF1768587.1 ATP-binding cassette domain-containing protein [Maricaulis sp.]
MSVPAIAITNLRFAWPGSPDLLAIDEFKLAAAESLFLAGASGSGKSTLLGLIAGITPANTGEISVLGEHMDPARAARRDAIRASQLGVIFQLFNLVPYLTPLENVLLPLRFSPERASRLRDAGLCPHQEAHRLLDVLGLDGDGLDRASTALSVGQQQRVAAARALLGRPGLVIADEPTSALDHDTRDAFLSLLTTECQASGAALLFVSHDRSLAARFDRSVELDVINKAGGSR